MLEISKVDYKKLHFMTVGEEMRQIVSPLTRYGITYFGFSRVNRNREESFLTSRLDSAHIWYEGKFYEKLFCDEVDKYFNTNVLWKNIAASDLIASDLFNIFSETVNIGHGISLVRKYTDYVDHFYFATERSNESINLFYINNLDFLEAFILCFYDKAKRLIVEAEKSRVYTPECIDTSLLTSKKLKAISCNALQNDYKDFLLDLYELSKKEKLCVILLLKGHRTKAIAEKLYLSSRTVEKHLQSAREKTGSKTLYELVNKLGNLRCY